MQKIKYLRNAKNTPADLYPAKKQNKQNQYSTQKNAPKKEIIK